jgi:hypothetical protein
MKLLTFFWLFLCTSLFSSTVLALESVQLFVSKTSPELTCPVDSSANAISTKPDQWLVIGSFSKPGFSIPTSNHIAIYDQSGELIPLLIDRSALTLEADKITALRFAFIMDSSYSTQIPLRLVWSKEKEGLGNNVEMNKLAISSRTTQNLKSFTIQTSLEKSNATTVIVEVDEKSEMYHWWYFLPILLILGLAWAQTQLRKGTHT